MPTPKIKTILQYLSFSIFRSALWPPRAELFFAGASCRCWCRHGGPQKSKLYCNTFHLPPLGALCDHPELSYCPLEKTWRTDGQMNGQTDDEGAFNIDYRIFCYVWLNMDWTKYNKFSLFLNPKNDWRISGKWKVYMLIWQTISQTISCIDKFSIYYTSICFLVIIHLFSSNNYYTSICFLVIRYKRKKSL